MFSKIILFPIHISCPAVKFSLIFLFFSLKKKIYQSLSIQPSSWMMNDEYHPSILFVQVTTRNERKTRTACLQLSAVGVRGRKGLMSGFPSSGLPGTAQWWVSFKFPLPVTYLDLTGNRKACRVTPSPTASTSRTAYQKLVHIPFKQANLSATVKLQWPMWDRCPAGVFVFWKPKWLCDWS